MSQAPWHKMQQTQTDLEATAGGAGNRRLLRDQSDAGEGNASRLPAADGEMLYDTAEYLQLALEKAKSEVRSLGKEESPQQQVGAVKSTPMADALALAMGSPQFKRVIGRLCDAERNLSIERDRYARLLARNADAMRERADDAQRIKSLQALVFEYEKLIALQRAKLDEAHGLTSKLAQLSEPAAEPVSPGGRHGEGSGAGDRPPRLESEDLLDELYLQRNALRESMSNAKHTLREVDATIVRLRNGKATIDQV